MFKSKEDLIKESDYMPASFQGTGYIKGVEDAFSSITERKKFYLKYYNNEQWFSCDNTRDYIEYQKTYPNSRTKDMWRDWLFHFCFDGVK